MWNSGIISSRHRGDAEYLLNLNAVNQDWIDSNLVDNGASTSGVLFEFGCVIDVDSITNLSNRNVIIGRPPESGASQRFYISVETNGSLRFLTRASSSTELQNFINDYSGIVEIKGRYKTDNSQELLVNNIVVATNNSSRPNTSNASFWIGGFNFANNSFPTTGNFFNGNIYSFFVNDNFWDCNEGSGFSVFSDLTTEAIGSTSNAGGLTYWNNNVWQII